MEDDVDLDLLISLTMIMITLMFFFIQRGKCVRCEAGVEYIFFTRTVLLCLQVWERRSAINPLNITVFLCSLFRCAIYREYLSTKRVRTLGRLLITKINR